MLFNRLYCGQFKNYGLLYKALLTFKALPLKASEQNIPNQVKTEPAANYPRIDGYRLSLWHSVGPTYTNKIQVMHNKAEMKLTDA